jgi:hypothetical protein
MTQTMSQATSALYRYAVAEWKRGVEDSTATGWAKLRGHVVSRLCLAGAAVTLQAEAVYALGVSLLYTGAYVLSLCRNEAAKRSLIESVEEVLGMSVLSVVCAVGIAYPDRAFAFVQKITHATSTALGPLGSVDLGA